MGDCKYYNEFIRCYPCGKVERCFKRKGWCKVENTNNNGGYNQIKINGKIILRHRLIAFCFLGLECINERKRGEYVVDHEDGDKLNNCVENLRITDQKGNAENRPTVKGYSWHKQHEKWIAQIMTDGKLIYLGLFLTEEEARQSYLTAKEIYHTTFNNVTSAVG